MSIVTQRHDMRADILALIKSLTGKDNMLTIPVEFIHYAGSLDAALFLSQLLYWSGKGKRKDGFIYKTYKEWKEEIHLGEYEIRKSVKVLKEKGILETDVKRANGSPTCHYRLDGERFSESFLEFLQERTLGKSANESSESEESLTEITTEINDTEYITSLSPDGDGEGEDKNSIKSISDEIRRRLLMLVPIIPDYKTERAALTSIAQEVYRGTCTINDVLLCAEFLLDDMYKRSPITPGTIYRELGTFLSEQSLGAREMLMEYSAHPELFSFDNDQYEDEGDDDDDIPY